MELSIVTTLYKSEEYIIEFYERISRSATQITDAYELIFVNDASPDNSLILVQKLAKKDPHVRVIDMARNYGQHRALYTGLEHALGNRVFTIDNDLEEKPELLQRYIDAMNVSGADIVYGVQKKRQRSYLYRWAAWCTEHLFWLFFPYPPPRNHVTARLMSHRYIAALLALSSNAVVISALCARVPYSYAIVDVEKSHKGTTTYTWWRYCLLVRDILLCSEHKILRFVLFPVYQLRRMKPVVIQATQV